MKKKRAKKIVRRRTEKELAIEQVSSELNPRQQLFCQLFTFSKGHFGNGTRAYMTAYYYKESQTRTAKTQAHVLLTNPTIREYIKKLLREKFANIEMDLELAKVAGQDSNLFAKMDAIKEYNKMMNRVSEKVEVTILPEPIMGGFVGKRKVAV